MNNKIIIIFEKDNNGFYLCAPELPGCHLQGETIAEASTYIKEAVELYLENLTPEERNELLSKEILTTSMEVKVED